MRGDSVQLFKLWLSLLILSGCCDRYAETNVSSADYEATMYRSDRAGYLSALLMDRNSSHVMVVAHRGCWDNDDIPENSIASIRRCIQIGVDIIELDVRVTRDGVPVLLHDDSLDRTTTGTGLVADLNWSDIRELPLKPGAGGEVDANVAQRVPTLEEALQEIRGKILINLDIKAGDFDQTFAVVSAVKIEDQILMKMVAAPHDTQLTSAEFLGRTKFMPIIRDCVGLAPGQYCSRKLSDAVPGYDLFNPIAYEVVYTNSGYLSEGIGWLLERGRVWVNTLEPNYAGGLDDEMALDDPDAVWGSLVRSGVSIIQTDYPEALLEYLENTGKRMSSQSVIHK